MTRIRVSTIIRSRAGSSPWQRGGREPYTGDYVNRQAVHPAYRVDITADGTRAVVLPAGAEPREGTLHATFLLNFFDEVRRRIPR